MRERLPSPNHPSIPKLSIIKKYSWLSFFFLSLVLPGCKQKDTEAKGLKLEDIFEHPPLTIASVTKSYTSNISADALNDMEEPILCISTKISDQLNTYFIQPDKVLLKELAFTYKDASIVDMKTALLIKDVESGKETLIYLPGRFPIDSMSLKPDVIIPVLGISRYQSKVERISSRWTQIVCKCADTTSSPILYKDRTINDCDTGGPGINECTLTTEGSLMSCQTECRSGSIACCWFEF